MSRGRKESHDRRREFPSRSPPPAYESIYPTHVRLSDVTSGNDQRPTRRSSSPGHLIGTRERTSINRRRIQSSNDDNRVARMNVPSYLRMCKNEVQIKTDPGVLSCIDVILEEQPNADDIEFYQFGTSTAAPHRTNRNAKPEYAMLEKLSKQQAQAELQSHVKAQCCYSTKTAKRLQVDDVTTTCAWQYRLQSEIETRELVHEEEPYKGGVVDGSKGKQDTPDLWKIKVNMSSSNSAKKRIPQTSQKQNCSNCNGYRTTTCQNCSGSGKITCNYCRGIGHTASHDVLFEHLDHNNHQPRRISRNETCHHCGGSGTEVCSTCHGCGRCSCCHCNGCGEVVKYLAVHVKRDTLCDQRVTNTHNLPSSLFKRCGGLIVFQDTNEALTPLTKDICLNKDMQIVSRELLNSHRPPNMAHSNRQQKIKHQTHIVRLVPIHKVTYSYRGKGGYVYWVVGMEKDVQVYCPDYPNTFCGCAIM